MSSPRVAAAEQLAGLTWPEPTEEIWRYSRINELDLDQYRPFGADALGAPGVENAPGGGPIAAQTGERAGLVVVRDGRVVHHELDESLESKGVTVCDLATCEEDQVRATLGTCSDASPDAFTVLHDAFLSGGAFVQVPAGVVVDKPIVVLHWSEGGLRLVPAHARGPRRGAELTVVERFGSPDAMHLVDAVVELLVADGAHLRYVSVQEHGPRTWQIALQRAHVGRDASLRSSAVALGGDYARLRSESLLAGSGAESDLLAVYFGDQSQMLDFRTLQDHDAPHTRSNLLFKGAVEDTARSVYSGLVHLRESAQKARRTRRTATSCSPRARAPSRSRTSRSRRTTCSARTRPPSGRSTTTSSTTSRAAASRPRRRSASSCSGFFDDVLDRLPVPRSRPRCAAP